MIVFKPMTRPDEWQWFADRTHVLRCEDAQGICAYDKRGLCAVVVFDTWTPVAVNVHMAISNPMSIRAGLFTEVAVHGFHVAGKERMFGLVPSNNEKALKLNRHIGFREVCRVEDTLADGIDTVVMRIDKRNCRWLPEELRVAA